MPKFHPPVCVGPFDIPEHACEAASRYRETELTLAVLIDHGHPEVAIAMWEAFSDALREETLQRAVMRLAVAPADAETRRLTLLYFDTVGVDLRF